MSENIGAETGLEIVGAEQVTPPVSVVGVVACNLQFEMIPVPFNVPPLNVTKLVVSAPLRLAREAATSTVPVKVKVTGAVRAGLAHMGM